MPRSARPTAAAVRRNCRRLDWRVMATSGLDVMASLWSADRANATGDTIHPDMRVLFAIPHFFNASPSAGRHGSTGGDPGPRVRALSNCLAAIQQLFGRPQCVIDIARRTTVPANKGTSGLADVVVCTTGSSHVLDQVQLGNGYFTHHATSADPRLLGFECHAVLRDRLGGYDYYCYLEDDLLIRDPWFFVKLRWFAGQCGDEALLMPNRFEVARGRIVHKAYVDGPIRPDVTAEFQDITHLPLLDGEVMGTKVTFFRPLNPHSGAFFLNPRQMATWAAKPYFLDRDVRFIGPLESAASLGVMRTFRIYKPAPETGSFLEIEHPGNRFLNCIRLPEPTPSPASE